MDMRIENQFSFTHLVLQYIRIPFAFIRSSTFEVSTFDVPPPSHHFNDPERRKNLSPHHLLTSSSPFSSRRACGFRCILALISFFS